MFYNAIIRDRTYSRSNDGVIGRVFISDLKQVPSRWTIFYRGNELGRNTDLEGLMCNPQDPITIFKPEVHDLLYVKTFTETISITDFDETVTVETLKGKIQAQNGIPSDEQRIIFAGKQLEDSRLLMGDYGVQKGSTVHLVLRLGGPGRGQLSGPFPTTVNLEDRRVSGHGVPATYPWEGYTIGLNLLGVCPIKTCPSNTAHDSSKQVIMNAKYGVVRMSKGKNKFECPACKLKATAYHYERPNPYGNNDDDEIGLFTPKIFIVSFGRALFRFKEVDAGLDQPVKTVLLESLGLDDEYKKFEKVGGDEDYDLIEIITCGRGSSPYHCLSCGNRCSAPDRLSLNAEIILECGHAYHRKCAPGNQKCFVCDSNLLDCVNDLLWTNEESGANEDRKRKLGRTSELVNPRMWDDEYQDNSKILQWIKKEQKNQLGESSE